MGFYRIYTDGGARGNPGPAGIGVVIEFCEATNDCSNKVKRHRYLGTATNNQAEYQALITAVEELAKLKPQHEVNFYLDSLLVVEQMKGNYKIKNAGLIPLYNQVKLLLGKLDVKISFDYIPRERNKLADKLVNQAINEGIIAKTE